MTDRWSTACPDWKERIKDRRSLISFPPLFPASADVKMRVFKSLKVVDLGINPATGDFWTIGESAGAWVLEFAAAIFGGYNPETGVQEITSGLLLVSKKNTKSTIAAGIMLTELICGWRPSDENLILAPTIEIAGNSFKPACDMIKHDDELRDMFHIQTYSRLITHRVTGASLKVVAADSATVGGKKASRVLIDELWLFGLQAEASSMFAEATGGQASRPEGYTLYLTTQSDKPPAGVFKEKLAYARDVRDGVIDDPHFLPVLYEFPPEMVEAEDHLKPENFYITNPNLGRSVRQEYLAKKFAEACASDESTLQVWCAKHLNIQIGQGLRYDAWIGANHWPKAKAKPELWDGSLDHLLEVSEVIVAGGDGGGLDDLMGLALLGRHKDTKDWLLWGRAWAQLDVFERRKDIVSQLEDFIREGTLSKCESPTQDLQEFADILERVKDAGLFPEQAAIGLDPQGITALVDELSSRGFTDEQMIAVTQGFRLSGAIWGMERRLKARSLLHGGQGLMSWCVGNAKSEQRGNAVLITKQIAGKAKIDPLIAAFNAVMLMTRNPTSQGAALASPWDDPEFSLMGAA